MSDLKYKIIDHADAYSGTVSQGLRTYMMRVYAYMFLGLLITGAVAFGAVHVPALQNALFTLNSQGYYAPSGLTWLLMFVQVGMVLFLSFRINRLEPVTAQALFWGYAALMGLTLSSLFLAYTGASLTRVFFITSGTFGAMSLYGYTTKRDLSSMGSFLIMALIGMMITSVVNIFLKSSMVEFVVSALGVLVFVGLTAYDTQRIKEIYLEDDSHGVQTKKAVMGALALYLDFINLFLLLLRFLGDRR